MPQFQPICTHFLLFGYIFCPKKLNSVLRFSPYQLRIKSVFGSYNINLYLCRRWDISHPQRPSGAAKVFYHNTQK